MKINTTYKKLRHTGLRHKGKHIFTDCSLMVGCKPSSIAWSSQMSKGHPCTNVPVRCSGANCNQFVWSYNLKAHWTRRHGTDSMPFSLSKQSKKLAKKEDKWVMYVATKGGSVPPEWPHQRTSKVKGALAK